VVPANIVVSTTAPHTVAMHSNGQRYYFAALLGMGLPFGILFVVVPRRRRSGLLALMLLAIVVTVPACGGGGGGGGSSQQHQDPGTPAGTYTITVTATAGSITQQGAFTLLLQ
jgi:hypothetical protein